jgi:Sulfatase
MKWNWLHYGAILSAVGILALCGWGMVVSISVLLKKCRLAKLQVWVHHAYAWMACCIFIRSVVSILDRSMNWPWLKPEGLLGGITGKLILYGLIPFAVLLVSRRQFTVFAKKLCGAAFILLCVFAAMGLIYPRYGLEADLPPLPPVAGERPSGGKNVFILIFDEWTFDRTYPGGELRDDLPHLKTFSQNADTYYQYYSAGSCTMPSISRFLLQKDDAFCRQSYEELVAGLQENRTPAGPNLFTGRGSHFRAIFGSHLDYRLLVGGDVGYVASVPFLDTLTSFSQRLSDLLMTQLSWTRYLGVPISKFLKPNRGGAIRRLQWMTATLYELAERTQREPIFAFCHLLIPHYPMVWDSDGVVGQMENRTEVEQYLGNLRYMDVVLGRFVDILQEAGTLDDTLIIITSDHSWRFDPDQPTFDYGVEDGLARSWLKHVPLIIKRPDQTGAGHIREPFSPLGIYSIVEQVAPSLPGGVLSNTGSQSGETPWHE